MFLNFWKKESPVEIQFLKKKCEQKLGTEWKINFIKSQKLLLKIC